MSRVRVVVPASAANLGPGFDSLGLALSLYNRLVLHEEDRVSVVIEGEGAATLEQGEQNVVMRAARAVYQEVGKRFLGLRVTMRNEIPPSRGLGSSAAAWVAGVAGANALLGSPLSADQLLALAARLEGHPDNVAAACLGGLTISCLDGQRVVAVSLRPAPSLSWVVSIPDCAGSTAEARSVLPASVSRVDAVFSLSRACLLVSALQQGRGDLLRVAMDDRLHQPYRRQLFPWMDAMMDAARNAGALGTVLSGAGPSILSVVQGDAAPVVDAMTRELSAASLGGRVIEVAVDTVGVQCEQEA